MQNMNQLSDGQHRELPSGMNASRTQEDGIYSLGRFAAEPAMPVSNQTSLNLKVNCFLKL